MGDCGLNLSVNPGDRRPLKTRSWKVFQQLAASMARHKISPNHISAISVVCAALGAGGLVMTNLSRSEWLIHIGWLIAVAGIQLRLIANLLDGMVAVEGGRASATGPLFNEVPDRISDPILLVAAGYSLTSDVQAGWAAAVCSLFVAYVRAIGASLHAGQCFAGPMAKQQRMALLTLVSTIGIVVPSSWLKWQFGKYELGLMQVSLWLIVIGCLITSVRRLGWIANHLRRAGELS